MKRINLLFALSAFAFAACTNQPQGEGAEVSEAKDVTEVAEKAVNYTLNTEKSTINWVGSKPAGKHMGTIGVNEGFVAVEGGNITGGKVVIGMSTVTSTDLADNEEMLGKLVGHLKSADFFDVENHPTAEFVITSVEVYDVTDSIEVKEEFDTEFKPAAANEYLVENATHKVTGNLTLRGTTLSIAFPAKVSVEGGSLKADAKFNIDRTLWGVMYGDEASAVDKAKDKFVYNTVNVGFSLEATKDGSETEM